MRYIKSYNESKDKDSLDVNELDGIIMDIFSELTDIGYSLEVLHQNGYASYHVLPPDRYDTLVTRFDSINNLRDTYLANEIQSSLGDYANMLLEINKELPGIHGRVMDIPGIERFDIHSTGHIEMHFRNKQQGYGNLGSVMLVGPKNKSIYAG